MAKYTLKEISELKKNKFKVVVIADSNDGDYITVIETYNKHDFEEYVINDIIDLLKNYSKRHQLEGYEGSCDFIPYSDWGICHTLECIEVSYIDEDGHMWEVDLGNE